MYAYTRRKKLHARRAVVARHEQHNTASRGLRAAPTYKHAHTHPIVILDGVAQVEGAAGIAEVGVKRKIDEALPRCKHQKGSHTAVEKGRGGGQQGNGLLWGYISTKRCPAETTGTLFALLRSNYSIRYDPKTERPPAAVCTRYTCRGEDSSSWFERKKPRSRGLDCLFVFLGTASSSLRSTGPEQPSQREGSASRTYIRRIELIGLTRRTDVSRGTKQQLLRHRRRLTREPAHHSIQTYTVGDDRQ